MLAGCCKKADCYEQLDFIQFQLLKDGVNAVGGVNALINRDHIHYYPLDNHFTGSPVLYVKELHLFSLVLLAEKDYLLILDDYTTDTISIEGMQGEEGVCGCFNFIVTKVIYNNEVVCNYFCEEGVVVVELK